MNGSKAFPTLSLIYLVYCYDTCTTRRDLKRSIVVADEVELADLTKGGWKSDWSRAGGG